MIKCLMVCGVLILAAMISQDELPFTETATLNEPPSSYSSEVVTLIYQKKGTTYECVDHMVRIDITPQLWDSGFDGRSYKDVFFKVLVAVTMTDAEGRITADFVSHLNCTRTDCADVTSPFFLFWDHAGENRADKAGEVFDEQNPVIVADDSCIVEIRLVQFLENPWNLFGECGEPCISDAGCVQPLRGLTLQVSVGYTRSYLQLLHSLEEGAARSAEGDELKEQGSLEEALEQYEKAETIYRYLGDEARREEVRRKIHEGYSTLAEEYVARGDRFFQSQDFVSAKPEYEKAIVLFETIGSVDMVADVEKKVEMCETYQSAHKEYDQGLTFLTAARNAANQEESLSRYREAREKFEKALNSFLLLEDQDKVEKCSNWIDLCDKRTGLLQEPDKNQTKTGYAGYWVFALIGGGLAVAVAGVLWLKKTK